MNENTLKVLHSDQDAIDQLLKELQEDRDVLDSIMETNKKICTLCKEITGATTVYISVLADCRTQHKILHMESTEFDVLPLKYKNIRLSGLSENVFSQKIADYNNKFQSDVSNCFLPKEYRKPQNALFAPICIENEVSGFIGLSNNGKGFSENDKRLVSDFAELVAITFSRSIAQKSLENSEARFRSVAETASEAIINIDKQGQIIYWNKAASQIFGYSKQEIFDKPLTMIMPEKFRKKHLEGLERVVSTGQSELTGKSFELVGLRKNGEEFPLELSLSNWEMGAEKYFTGIVRDISERKKMQKELMESKRSLEQRVAERTEELVSMNEKLQLEIQGRKKVEKEIEAERKRLFTVLDALPASVHLLKPDHSIIFANRYFRHQFGEKLEKPCYKILHGLEAPCSVCNAFEVLSSGKAGEYEESHADGKLYRVYNYPFTDTDGSSLILQLGIDITAHKKAEDALRKSEERFRVLVNSIDDTVFTLDRKKRFLEIYGSLFDRLGISARESLKKSINNIFDSETSQDHEKAISRALSGENVIYEWSNTVDDHTRYIQNSISPIFDETGKTEGVVGVARDITEQKRLEKQQVETEKLMTVAEMSAMISHEFRNSLTSVRMILELQNESENLTPAEKKSLSVALSSLNHMEDVVTQLLNFSRPKPMEFKLEKVNSIILESVDFTSAQFQKRDIEVSFVPDDSLPSMKIDRNHLKEAIINLILNSIQAIKMKDGNSQSGRIDIKTEKHFLLKTLRDVVVSDVDTISTQEKQMMNRSELIMAHGDASALITIADNGIGIKSENLKRIFNPFYTTTVQGGTGLGLSTVKRTVNAHKGIIRVESEFGKGTTFKIYLPLLIE